MTGLAPRRRGTLMITCMMLHSACVMTGADVRRTVRGGALALLHARRACDRIRPACSWHRLPKLRGTSSSAPSASAAAGHTEGAASLTALGPCPAFPSPPAGARRGTWLAWLLAMAPAWATWEGHPPLNCGGRPALPPTQLRGQQGTRAKAPQSHSSTDDGSRRQVSVKATHRKTEFE